MRHEIQQTEHGYIIDGIYALYPIPNAFNNKTSYWMSKNGYTVARYCFSTKNAFSVEEQLEHIGSYIRMFEESLSPQKTIDTADPELTGRLVDVVEDWMEENGFDGIAVQDEDYDFLSARFRTALGLSTEAAEISKDLTELKEEDLAISIPAAVIPEAKKHFSMESPIEWGRDSTGTARVKYGDMVFTVSFYAKDLEHAIYYDRHLFAKEPQGTHEVFRKWFAEEIVKVAKEK